MVRAPMAAAPPTATTRMDRPTLVPTMRLAAPLAARTAHFTGIVDMHPYGSAHHHYGLGGGLTTVVDCLCHYSIEQAMNEAAVEAGGFLIQHGLSC